MRDHDAALLACGGRVREVSHIAADLTGLKSLKHIGFVDESVACGVDDDDAILHHGDRLGVDHALRGFESRHVDRDEIACAVDRLDVLAVLDCVIEIPCGIDRKVGIVSIDLHAERDGGVRDLLPNGAKANHAKLLARYLGTCKSLLRLLSGLVDRRILNIGLHPLDAADNVTGSEQHGRDHKLLHAVCVRTGRIEYDNTLLCVFRVRYVVHTGACTSNGKQVVARGKFIHLCATYEHGIRCRKILRTGVFVRQVVEAHIRNRIEAHILVVHLASFLSF